MKKLLSLVILMVFLSITLQIGQSQVFNWKAFSGESITVLFVEHPFTKAILPYIKEFTDKTGINVNFLSVPEAEYWDKLTIDLASGAGTYDVFMTGPSLEWQYAWAGWIEPLDRYLNNPRLTSPEYDIKDFYPAFLAANRWNLTPGKGIGLGNQWAIPVMVETSILAYRKDIFTKYNIKIPETWEEWAKTAEELSKYTKTEGIYPVIQRGARDITSIQAGYYTAFATYGGKDFDERMRCIINSPQGVKITEIWVDTIKKYGPPDWTAVTWYEMMERFATGKYGMIVDCDFFAATYEDPQKSAIAGKVGYALAPKGPDGKIRSNIWTWALGMNAKSKNKEAAWYFIQWVTSKEILLKSALYGNLDPVRKSVWNHPDVVKMVSKWDGGNWRKVVTENLEKYAAWRPSPQTELVGMWTRWIEALHEVWAGRATVKAALDAAAKDIDALMLKAGMRR